ncbi:hypothetical protein [Citrobacter sp. Igbk 16]|uniref:hypothetical protein n=1 Tax=Citrobacter sp. Igbk 16 TaxID=2963958 RepID=UPI002303670E|nr:hypothetical protein [Citrobacter sp. Igbk 16]MDA8515696.1 hypothetical protein [Citrobacter sp. Igbk 16]
MPVDLSVIPPATKRRLPPSVKRWSVILLVFIVCGGLFTSLMWPSHSTVRGVLFWNCFISLPFIIWLFIFGIRWLSYLTSVWLTDGWNHEREKDIENEIQRGQRYLTLEAVCTHLPHVVTSGVMTDQFIIPRGVELPTVVDEVTQIVSYQSRFGDARLPLLIRIVRELTLLLEDVTLQTALMKCKASKRLTVVLQIDSDITLAPVTISDIKKEVKLLVPGYAQILFSSQFGLADIDNWLDNPRTMDYLLVLSINLRTKLHNGEGEAAVALLLHSTQDDSQLKNYIAHIHRPEKTTYAGLNASVMQSLLWGKSNLETIEYLWLSGMGAKNEEKTQVANNIGLPLNDTKAKLIDIDMKSGFTGSVSPWLAIALASGNHRYPSPQLIASMSEHDDLLWSLVVRPQIQL